MLEEFPRVRVQHVGLGDALIHPVLDHLGSGVVTEHVVYRGGQLESALVPVALHGIYPLGVDHPGPEDPAGFVGQVPDLGAGGVGAIAEKLTGIAAGQRPDGGNHTAMVLHIVITVEYIMLAVVLVFSGHHNLTEPPAELLAGVHPVLLLGVGVTAPRSVHLSQVIDRFPIPLLNHREYPSAVGAGLAPENSVKGSRARCPRLITGGSIRLTLGCWRRGVQVLVKMLYDQVVFRRLVQGSNQLECLVQEVDQVGEGVAEEPADAHRHIGPGTAQLFQRDYLQPHNPAALGLPHRADAQEAENLGDVVAMSAHGRGAPNHQAHHFRKRAFFSDVFFQQVRGKGLTRLPSGR